MVDEGELYEETPEEPVVTSKKPKSKKAKKAKTPAVKVSEEDLLEALEKAGGTAKSGQLRDNINKENYPSISSPALGTAIRKKALEMAKEEKIQAIHVNDKRNWTFKVKE